MSHRVIKGLKWAMTVARPRFASTRCPRGAKGQGVKYERAIAKELGAEWTRGQWFQFEDSAGCGFCQLDFHRVASDGVFVLEAKLSWTAEGHSQLEQLYRPVVEKVWGKPMIGLVISHRLIPGTQAAIAHSLPSALQAARNCKNVVLHWSTKGPLIPALPSNVIRLTPKEASNGEALNRSA